MTTSNPNPKPFFTGYLPEQDVHQIYYEQYGNVKGPVIVVLHGGPGSKSRSKQAGTYDLSKYHVILFDQRGCGQSTPAGKVTDNTTQKLVEDIERIRLQLNLTHWFVAGSSWGSTLALTYAQTHPDRVKGLLLGSVFLGRARDEEWAFSREGGISRLFPDLWEERQEFLKKHHATTSNAAQVLLKMIETGSEKEVKVATAAVRNWEGNLMTAQENLSFIDPEDIEEEHINEAKIFLHYETHDFFLTENQLLKNIDTIKSIPTILIHGRYDLLCPAEQIWALAKKLQHAETIILPTSNHRLTADGEIARKLAYNFFLSKHT
ncbi:MAG: Proline iminopeptidase [Microgenomates group bacterium GW2011_GWC1_46_16]|uniref:Proline iminopeptidase n=2 Tax=Candidatus Collieribacteriota TaxID=1752725 RepID=A0A1F5FZT1_9BACT|nr:MAG: Proline iminopeptidase [Microgenomates group bacterium GW2011_GWF1_46_12]KKU25650.1 MAG: Proline iminopeptidase [Microgenomates group bacterium GW2011_GWC1_46_16]KKU27606.1 MAG: Proline iminopeptidase [Microgenomates group bacterium GW2011_GWF2_46_18]KKU44777.1 MAG: Proline iminopeptidase [Microgenomates group bacterium GW2011_GWB1_46_7]KKU60190.1 MAG: Proline iminopeptidase [Microgenomates group bacterium GW2011_GWE1_47_12]KKU60957.1 MAG: Proline iminopeptidase [Microgenomates group b